MIIQHNNRQPKPRQTPVAALGVVGLLGLSSCDSPSAAGTAVRDCAGVDHARAVEFARDAAVLTESLAVDPVVSCTSEGALFLSDQRPWMADLLRRVHRGSVTVSMVGATTPIGSCPHLEG